jgi:anaerobic selenocysteine-containing dehydrogenase
LEAQENESLCRFLLLLYVIYNRGRCPADGSANQNKEESWRKASLGEDPLCKDGPGGCALLVGVKENRIVQVKGDPEGFLNRGYVCPKGMASPDRLTHPDRLRYPLITKGGPWRGEVVSASPGMRPWRWLPAAS